MTQETLDLNQTKKTILDLLLPINREGIPSLIKWLESSDFFQAPASTKNHSAYPGGLAEHSLGVYNRLKWLCDKEPNNGEPVYNEETIKICGLLHDVCKVRFYGTEFRNVKEEGRWIQKEVYVIKDKLPFGHGEKSVLVIRDYILLNFQETLAIRWHMGSFEGGVALSGCSTSYSFTEAQKQCKLVTLMHCADLLATADELTEGK